MVLLIILFNQRTHVASSYKYLATAMSSFCSFFLVFSNRTCQVFCLARSYKPPHPVAFFFFFLLVLCFFPLHPFRSLAGLARCRLEATETPQRRGPQHLLGFVAAKRRSLAERSGPWRQDRASAVGSLPGDRQALRAGVNVCEGCYRHP